ncbi:class I lanthipeptide [Christiangramia sp. SM2212]|uniref:class I lanthipeptide n=1 Tax=Christiangramia sediminicola TaxID=3073267 RepID=UPI0038CF50AA
MKKRQLKGKFNLEKESISKLQSSQITGGKEAAGTTSFNVCSNGFICCGKGTRGSFIITGCP